jgi:hypothetical protein
MISFIVGEAGRDLSYYRFQSQPGTQPQHHLICLVIVIAYLAVEDSVFDLLLDDADFPRWTDAESLHDELPAHRRLEVSDTISLLYILELLPYSLKSLQVAAYLNFIFICDVGFAKFHQRLYIIPGFKEQPS